MRFVHGWIIGATLALAWQAGQAPAAGAIEWQKSFAAARSQAQKSKKRLLVDFYADWCGPCKMMDATTFKDARVVELSQKYVMARVNVDREPKLAARYGVETLPRFFVMDAKGKVLRELASYNEAKAFSLFMLQGMP